MYNIYRLDGCVMLVLFAHFFVRLVKCHNSIEIKTKLIRFLYLLTLSIWGFVCLRLFVNFNFILFRCRAFQFKVNKKRTIGNQRMNISSSAHTRTPKSGFSAIFSLYLHSFKVFSLETNSNDNGIVFVFVYVSVCARLFVTQCLLSNKLQSLVQTQNEQKIKTSNSDSQTRNVRTRVSSIYYYC